MTTRIYTVYNDDVEHLVRATHRNQAIATIARQVFSCRVATQDDLIRLTQAGAKVLDAKGADNATEGNR